MTATFVASLATLFLVAGFLFTVMVVVAQFQDDDRREAVAG